MSGGMIERAFLCGSHDPAMYYKKFPRTTWNQKGGYEIQATPNELAALVTHTRGWIKGNRMLCVGTGTLGAERFMAENLPILEMDYIGEALPANVSGMTIKVKKVDKPSGVYDLITVFGTAKVDKLFAHTKIGTLIAFLGIGPASKNPALRSAWMGVRKKHMTMLQTGGEPWQTGTGLLKVLFAGGQDAVQKQEAESVDVQERAGNGPEVGSGDPKGKDAPKEGEEDKGNENDTQAAVKWSRAFDKCQGCGTTEKKHVSKGLCKTCYPKGK